MNLIYLIGHKIFLKPPQNPPQSTFFLKWDMVTISEVLQQDMSLGPLAQK
jgi:hypothetical protein